MNWNKLFHNGRRKDKQDEAQTFGVKGWGVREDKGLREQIERDYDRILFLAPTRRLADKTQVFPLEQNDSVRTRLTHSYEVSNLARSIGTQLAYEHAELFENDNSDRQWQLTRALPSLLATIGLAHDLGNPPFGHQGESAIQDWFKGKATSIFPHHDKKIEEKYNDFLSFDGNSQTIRLLTQLQILNDKYGINLTYGTLAAMLKYPQSSSYVASTKEAIDKWEKSENKESEQQPKALIWKKHGYFFSEAKIVDDIWKETELKEGVRHPLTYIMEACDDIAYSVLDAEDIVKKGLASFHDLINHLNNYIVCAPKRIEKKQPELNNDEVKKKVIDLEPKFEIIKKTIEASTKKHQEFSNPSSNLTPAELNDVSMQMFRVYAIGNLVKAVTEAFVENANMLTGQKDLMSLSIASELCDALKDFDLKWGYKNKAVLKLELEGHNYIHGLMDMLWIGIHGKLNKDAPEKSETPFGKYVYERISENYRRVFEDSSNTLPIQYKEAQLLTDAISGMTDSYLISLYNELKDLHKEFL